MISEITCDYIATARPIDRATLAELLAANSHRVNKCNACGNYHLWEKVPYTEWVGSAMARDRITADYYVQVGPNSYLHKGYRKAKKKEKGGDEDEN